MGNLLFQGSYVLPSNFEEVATGVLKVLNNLALIDINFMQRMLVSYFTLFVLSFYFIYLFFCWMEFNSLNIDSH